MKIGNLIILGLGAFTIYELFLKPQPLVLAPIPGNGMPGDNSTPSGAINVTPVSDSTGNISYVAPAPDVAPDAVDVFVPSSTDPSALIYSHTETSGASSIPPSSTIIVTTSGFNPTGGTSMPKNVSGIFRARTRQKKYIPFM